jgi:hypothetical protein
MGRGHEKKPVPDPREKDTRGDFFPYSKLKPCSPPGGEVFARSRIFLTILEPIGNSNTVSRWLIKSLYYKLKGGHHDFS